MRDKFVGGVCGGLFVGVLCVGCFCDGVPVRGACAGSFDGNFCRKLCADIVPSVFVEYFCESFRGIEGG